MTAVNDAASSLLTVFPNGTGRPQASNLNFTSHSNTANLVAVTLGQSAASDSNREVSVYNALGTVDVLADVEGYFAPQPSSTVAGEFHAMAPLRMCDTRGGCGPQQALVPGKPGVVNVTGGAGIPPDGSAAAAV